MFTRNTNILLHKNHKKRKPGLVASYDLQPGSGVGLFLKPWSHGGEHFNNSLRETTQPLFCSDTKTTLSYTKKQTHTGSHFISSGDIWPKLTITLLTLCNTRKRHFANWQRLHFIVMSPVCRWSLSSMAQVDTNVHEQKDNHDSLPKRPYWLMLKPKF